MKRIFRVILFFLSIVFVIVYVSQTHLVNNGESETDRMVTINDLESEDTVFAIRYQNDAWGHMDRFLIVNKEGWYKIIDNEKRDIGEEDLLSYMDRCLADDNVLFEREPLPLSNKSVERLINVNICELKKTNHVGADQGEYTYWYVFGERNNRKLVIMKLEGDTEANSGDREITQICDMLYSAYNSKSEK